MKTIKLKHTDDIHIDVPFGFVDGRLSVWVELRMGDWRDPDHLTPTEARRVARALNAAADRAEKMRAKSKKGAR